MVMFLFSAFKFACLSYSLVPNQKYMLAKTKLVGKFECRKKNMLNLGNRFIADKNVDSLEIHRLILYHISYNIITIQ